MRLDEAFLADIMTHPDDDAPRLIYADWLTDNGDPVRGEFIRVQCELARLPEADARRPALEWREAELLGRHQQRWMAPVAECCVSWPDFRRGFIEAVDASAAVVVDLAERLFAQAPIRELTLHDAFAHLSELARCPWLARLVTLRLVGTQAEPLHGVLPMRGFTALFGSPHLGGLRVLDLTGCSIGSSGVWMLAASRSLRALTELGLGGNEVTDDAVHPLSGLEQRGGLEVLDLRGNAITDRGAELLARSPHLRRLRWLRLEGNPLGDAGVEALLASATLTSLTHLTCDEGGLRAEVRTRLQARRERR